MIRGLVFAVLMAAALSGFGVVPAAAQDSGLKFKIELGTTIMHRETPDREALVTNAGTGATVLDGSDIDPGWEAGIQGRAVITTPDGWGIEVGGFAIAPYDDTFSSSNGAPTLVRINSSVPFFLPGVTSQSLDWRSEIFGLDANLFADIGHGIQVLAGLRYVNLDEQMDITYNAAVLPSLSSLTADNEMYGPQIGARVDVNALLAALGGGGLGPVSLELAGKAAYLSNNTQGSHVLNTGVVVVTAAGRGETSTLLLDGAVKVGYEVVPGVAVGLGYQIMYFDDVAQVTDQVATSNFFTGVIVPDSDELVYHGAQVFLTIELP